MRFNTHVEQHGIKICSSTISVRMNMSAIVFDLPTSNATIESADNVVFSLGETSALDVWLKIVQPSQTTTLTATIQALNKKC